MSARVVRSEKACGRAIKQMIEAVHNYCLEYKGATDEIVGLDAIIGDEGVKVILEGIRTLLNGPTGNEIDCGEMWAWTQRIAGQHGMLNENGELY